MIRFLPIALLALAAAACRTEPQLPHYMQALPRGEADLQVAAEEIRRELGPATRVEAVLDLYYLATNGGPEVLERSRATVARVHRALYGEYLVKVPERPVSIYLFKDDESYGRYCRDHFEKPPDTPFGFYLAGERKMVMNIATGQGTLAHELVHPLLTEDFPAVPSWFNEGFASLFEKSRFQEGRMVGVPNWRLPGLQRALRQGRAVSLREMTAMSPNDFYGDDRGVNYATARYLCLWLQGRGRLPAFYRDMKAGAARDPGGAAALERSLGCTLENFEPLWKGWVLGIRQAD